jgi:hypothetical protein
MNTVQKYYRASLVLLHYFVKDFNFRENIFKIGITRTCFNRRAFHLVIIFENRKIYQDVHNCI